MPEKCGLMPPGLGPVVQCILGCVCVSVLAYKCHIDKSGRGTVRFVFDSSKNFAGALWMHVANLIVAGILGRQASSGGDACQWYFIEIVVDTTLGVYVEYRLIKALLFCLKDRGGSCATAAEMIEAPCIVWPDAPAEDAEAPPCDPCKLPAEDHKATAPATPGDGGMDQPLLARLNEVDREKLWKDAEILWKHLDIERYFLQLFSWLGVVTCMKFVMVIAMLVLSPQLEGAAAFLLNPLNQEPTLKLLVVMILTPGIMNGVQFWLQDNIFVDVAKLHDKGQLAQANKKVESSAEAVVSAAESDFVEVRNKFNVEKANMVSGPVDAKRVPKVLELADKCLALQDKQCEELRGRLHMAVIELRKCEQLCFVSNIGRAAEWKEDARPKCTVEVPHATDRQPPTAASRDGRACPNPA